VLNGVLPQFVKFAGAQCGIINESLRAQKLKRDAACGAHSCGANGVAQIS
jgi:hypothetical protein